MNKPIWTALFIAIGGSAHAAEYPQASALSGDQTVSPGPAANPGSEKSKLLPGDPTISTYEITDPEVRKLVEKAQATMSQAQSMETAPSTAQEPAAVKVPEPTGVPSVALPDPEVKRLPRRARSVSLKSDAGVGFSDMPSGVRVFSQGVMAAKMGPGGSYTLPSTSIALATTLYGVEATGSEERFIPAELNYAWLGPNGAVVEMKNCRLWIRVRGDYSTERVYGKAETLSCRAPGGETFDMPVEAFMVDQEQEYLGAHGELVAHGKALATAMTFLSDGVKAFGSAMAAAQVTTEVATSGGLGEPVKGTNVGGDKTKYIAGQSLSGSSAKFLDWWIDYYQGLSPTIAIGPGKKIYLALKRTVQVPKIFFGSAVDPAQLAGILPAQPGQGPSKVNTNKALQSQKPHEEDSTP